MIYPCTKCGASLEGLSYPPFCPFCNTPFDGQGTEALIAEADKHLEEKNLPQMAAKLARAAEAGSAEAAYRYAVVLERGDGVRADLASALGYYKYAASRAHIAAAAALGDLYYKKYGDAQKSLAEFWLTVAAEGGNADAAYTLATLKTGSTAFYYYAMAALAGNKRAAAAAAEACVNEGGDDAYGRAKGFYLLAGTGAVKLTVRYPKILTATALPPMLPAWDAAEAAYSVARLAEENKEYFVALTFYARAATVDHAPSCTRIGDAYAAGNGVAKSRSVAAKWYIRAADAGDVDAMIALGTMFLSGAGVEKDERRALVMFMRCASLGNAQAEFLAAEMHFEGRGTARDIPAALALYEKSAEKGYAPAVAKREKICAAVGSVYNQALAAFRRGDHEEAVRGYTIAAEMGHSGAIANLGYCYQNGYGCKRNLSRAVGHYRRAVMYGKTSARYNLGLCYMTNAGVRFDAARAEALLRGSGHPEAEALIAAMKERKEKKKLRRLYALSTVLYRKGMVSEALAIATAAAGKGSKEAMCMIGCHYEFGMGVLRDMETARRFYWQSGYSLSAIDRLKRGFLRATVEMKKRG